ncbi:MAG: tetratricopeptide repeat protein [Brevinematales bacterium]|nr:tetratricopeptide repeat protein [Brevinematales bacterium]
MVKKVFLLTVFILLFILNDKLLSYNTPKYQEILTPSSEGISVVFTPFNSYSFSLFNAPQSFNIPNNYSLGLFLGNFATETIFSISGHINILGYPILLGLSSLNSQSEVYSKDFNYLGNYNQNFILLGIGTKLSNILLYEFGNIDLGISILGSLDIYSFPTGIFYYDSYILEGYFIPLIGATLKTYYNVDISLSQLFFIGGLLESTSLGFSSKLGIRYYLLSLFSKDKNIYKYLVIYPYISYTYLTSVTTKFQVNSYNNFRYGVGLNSEVLDNFKLSFGIDNKGWSFSLVLTFFSSPISIGNISHDSSQQYLDLVPSLYLVFNEATINQIVGISPDKEEVERGIVEFEKGNFTNANKYFDKALRINPSNEVAIIYKRKLMLWLESNEILTKEQQEYIKTLLTRANILRLQSKYGEAIKEYKKVLEINPYNKEANDGIKQIEAIVSEEINKNYREALNLYSNNELIEAKKVINRNLDLNPFHEPSINLSKEIDDRIQTETTKKLELEQRKSLSYSLYSQGMKEFSVHNFNKALELFNKALEIYPQNKDAEDAIKKTLSEIEASSKIQENKSRSDSLVAEGLKLKSEGKYWEAISKFREAIRFYRNNEIAKIELSNTTETIRAEAKKLESEGDELFINGKIPSAISKWNTAISLLKDLPEAVILKQKVDSKITELKANIDIKIANAKELLKSGDFTNAIKTINTVIKLEPTNKQAIEIYNQAKKIFDAYVDNQYSEGLKAYENGEYKKSFNIFDELVSFVPEDDRRFPKIKIYYNDSKQKLNQIELSRRIEEKIREADALLVNYDYEGAKKVLQEALKIDPNNSEISKRIKEIETKAKETQLRDEANLLLSTGLKEIRRKNYNEGISKLKESRNRFLSLGDDISIIDNYIKNAEEEFNLEKNTSFIEGKKAYEKGEYLKSKQLLEIALKNNPNSSEIKLLLTEVNNKLKMIEKDILDQADNNFRLGEYNKALEDYNTLSKISPDNPLYKFMIETIQKIKDDLNEVRNLFQVGEYSDALDIIDDLLALNPKDPNLQSLKESILEKLYAKVSTLRNEADDLIKREDYKKAINRLKAILKYFPDDADAKIKLSLAQSRLNDRISKNFTLGRNAYNSGNYKEAIRILLLVLDDDPNNTNARNLLNDARIKYNSIILRDTEKIQREIASLMSKGVEEYRKGNISKAIENWQKILDIDPSNEQARKYIARAKLGK